MLLRRIPILIAIASLSGCAIPVLTQGQATNSTAAKASEAVTAFANKPPAARVKEIDTPMSDFRKTEAPRVRGEVNIKAASAPFAPVLSELAKKSGYTVAFGDVVDLNRKITVDFTDAMTDDAIRTTAFLAGYVAVIDKNKRTVMVSDVATYVFRLPSGIFANLQAQYSVGGNPANASSGGTSGGASGGTSLKAEFTVAGRDGTNGQGLTRFLQDLAGKNAEVLVADSGIVSVRANAQALKRFHEFMRGFARDAMTQVEMEASVVEVSLKNEFSMGIQWTRVLETAAGGVFSGGQTALARAATAATAAANPSALLQQVAATAGTSSLGAYRVNANSSAIISALAQFTDVNIVSQPKLLSMNNVPATFFDGTQLPYLGSVQQTAGTAAGSAPTITGTVAFAIDGVSFSAIPSVVDANTVQITLIPVLSSVQGFSEFLNGTLTAPRQSNKQTYMRVLAESNKTLVLGGIRYSVDSKDTTLGTATDKKTSAKEIVILMRANIIPAPDFEPLVNESL